MQSLTQPSPSGEGFWLLSPAGEGLGMRVLPGEPWESAKVGCTLSELGINAHPAGERESEFRWHQTVFSRSP